jgi:tetratricopeptide (TPR) repeat protein
MNVIEQYHSLVDQERWMEALPIIQQIVQRGPHISTSWFNYGVCLSALGRESEAADKFLKAYELNPTDFGAQYRAFRSLFQARDYRRFLEFARRECEADPGMIEHLLKDEQFSTLFARPDFQQLKNNCEES